MRMMVLSIMIAADQQYAPVAGATKLRISAGRQRRRVDVSTMPSQSGLFLDTEMLGFTVSYNHTMGGK